MRERPKRRRALARATGESLFLYPGYGSIGYPPHGGFFYFPLPARYGIVVAGIYRQKSKLTDLPTLNTRWDERYPTENPEAWKRPSDFLVRSMPLLSGGRALDVACGPARNAVLLARHGFVVDGVDNSRAGLTMARRFMEESGVSVNLIFADLDRYVIRPHAYDLIINLFYLNREIIPSLIEGLKDGGYLIFESFTADTFRFMPGRDPKHYLAPNELLRLASGMRVLHYFEGTIIEAGMARATARLIARRQ